MLLPKKFADWFSSRNWQVRPYQLELTKNAAAGLSTLLIAPTGAGKTLAGFLPSLITLDQRDKPALGQKQKGLHTLYISPLKALTSDIMRNLEKPIAEMGLDITLETRTGDTPAHKRQRQRRVPPDILLTTPEQIALLIAAKDWRGFFADLDVVIIDELHALTTNKRGQLLALGLARLRTLRPDLVHIGLSATVSNPQELCRFLASQKQGELTKAELIEVKGGASPQISILKSSGQIPWAGHSARYAFGELYAAIKAHKTTLLFVNTRSQAELVFQELWKINDEVLPIALHHGSLDVSQRRRVEQAMTDNSLRAIVATSTLDLGIDWGDVDLVVHTGAPKGASRLAQRIGRANHRMDEASKALLVPANCFEVLECQAALDANYLGAQDTPPLRAGGFDVLAQHILGCAIAEPFDVDELYYEVISALPYVDLDRADFDRTLNFVATGGYALKTYERYAKIRQNKEGRWRISHPRFAQQYRLNIGTIIENPELQIRLLKKGRLGSRRGAGRNGAAINARGGAMLGKIEEGFVEAMRPGDTFLFAGKVLAFEGIRENICYVSQSADKNPAIPVYAGGKFPLSSFLAAQVRKMLSEPESWARLPEQVSDWLKLQRHVSQLPGKNDLLIETFPRKDQFYMVIYAFEGRLVHQTLGMLLTRRLERARARPLGFVATDYVLAIWGLRDFAAMIGSGELSLDGLFDEDMLGDDLEVWFEGSFLLKRTFRQCATIAGLIEKRHPGKEKTGRQMTISADLIYDVLREHEHDHLLLRATREEAAHTLLDVIRLGDMLNRIKGKIRHHSLERISPLAMPVMMEIGREPVHGEAHDALLAEAAAELLDEAGVK